MKIKTSELIGPALDWAVLETYRQIGMKPWRGDTGTFGPLFSKGYKYPSWGTRKYSPSTNWKEGGLIIEREKLSPQWDKLWGQWAIRDPRNAALSYMGATFLIAAMRCYVASKLGDEVDVPEELL